MSGPPFVRGGGLISATDAIGCVRGGSDAVPFAAFFEVWEFSWGGSGFSSWFPCPWGES